jgi:phage terminase large subunit-like protein
LLASLNEQERTKILSGYTEDQLKALLYDWDFWARPKQKAPKEDFGTWLLLAGRGWGKTRVAAEQIRKWKEQGYGRFAIVAETAADARDVLVEGPSGVLNISPPWDRPKYEPSKRRITWDNGAWATTYSGEDPEQLRGPEHEKALVDELAKYKYPQETWDNLQFGLRLGDNPQVILATTPKPIKTLKEIIAAPDTIITKGSTFENRSNLAVKFFERIVSKYDGTRLGRQELYAELLDDNPNALWQRDNINADRVDKAPELMRIVVAIDPAVSDPNKTDGEPDEAGIIVAGVDYNGHAYILDDASLQASPDKWMGVAIHRYHKWFADRIIAEKNNGGDMVEYLLRTKDAHIPYTGVWASRGKYVRAEPIAALYEQHRVHHVGTFGALEDELCEWTPGDKSPNRLDGLVWALTELMLPKKGKLRVEI